MHAAPAGSLLDFLSQIPDPRGRQGRRFSLSPIMATVVCGILCGYRGYESIANRLAFQDRKVWWLLGYWRKPPCANTLRDLMMALDPVVLEQVVRRWVESQLGDVVDEAKLSAVAMDGKSL